MLGAEMGQPIRGTALLASAYLISLCIFVCLVTQVFAAKYVTFSQEAAHAIFKEDCTNMCKLQEPLLPLFTCWHTSMVIALPKSTNDKVACSMEQQEKLWHI